MGKLYTLKPEESDRVAGWLAPGYNCTPLQYTIVKRAFIDIGIREKPLGSNRGVRIDKWTRRAGLPVPKNKRTGEGWWWCAVWVGCVYADAGALVPRGFPAVDSWLEHMVKEPVPGAAIIYGLRGDGQHIGIIADVDNLMLSIEGNRGYAGTTNNGVAVDIGPVIRKDILGYVHPKASE